MNYLLDTHTFLWWIAESQEIPPALVKKLGHASGSVYFSVVSLWELGLKRGIGKLRLPEPIDTYVLKQIQANRIELLPLHAPHVFRSLELAPHHRDPFDRMLVAQALVENLTLVSRDQALRAYPAKIVWD